MFNLKVSVLSLAAVFLSSVAPAGDAIANWPAPATWSPHRASHGVTTMGDISSPLPFIAVTPCRQYDSRNTSALPDNTNRAVTLTGAPCGIPAGAAAVSVNITIFGMTGVGGNGVFQVGTANDPTFAWINYPATETQRGNAGVVPLNGSGQIVVKANQGSGSLQFVVDVNGYYASTAATATDYFSVINSGLYAIYGQTSNPGAFAAGVYGRVTAGPAQGVFGETLSTTDGTAGVYGRATPSVGNNAGVFGQTNSATNGADGVFGIATATTGVTYGVEGHTNSTTTNASGVLGTNAASGETYGVLGVTFSSTGMTAGVLGVANSTTGETNGVLGVTFSSTDGTAGVLGVANSTTGKAFGVIGVSQSTAQGGAVGGSLQDPDENVVAQGGLGIAFGTAADTTTGPWGVFAFGNLGATGTKHFVEPHPGDPTKVILYSSLEGREVGTYFRGTSRIVNHQAVIDVPEDFRMVTDEEGLTVQLTPVGASSAVYVESQDLNRIVVRASRDVTFHYLVQGVRRAFKDLEPVRVGYEFVPRSPTDTMQPFLTEEAKRRLIANGTYNADGTVNMNTAERLGWTKAWKETGVKTRAAPRARPPAGAGTEDKADKK